MNDDDEVNKFEDFLKATITHNFLKKKLAFTNLFLFDCATQNRKAIFDNVLANSLWIAKPVEIEKSKAAFDYIYVQQQNFTARKLFNFIKENKTKVIIFNDDNILKSQALVKIIEGAVCHDPKTDEKCSVTLDEDHKFIFQGCMIFLTDMTLYKFKRSKKYFYICRDVKKV